MPKIPTRINISKEFIGITTWYWLSQNSSAAASLDAQTKSVKPAPSSKTPPQPSLPSSATQVQPIKSCPSQQKQLFPLIHSEQSPPSIGCANKEKQRKLIPRTKNNLNANLLKAVQFCAMV